MQLRRVASSLSLLGLGLYIWLPTADEVFIHPTFGFFLSYALHIPFLYGLALSIIVYRAIGTICLAGGILVGGKPAYHELRTRLKLRRAQNKVPERSSET